MNDYDWNLQSVTSLKNIKADDIPFCYTFQCKITTLNYEICGLLLSDYKMLMAANLVYQPGLSHNCSFFTCVNSNFV